MRTKGILLVRDTILLLGVIPADGERYLPRWFRLKFNFLGSRCQIWALAAGLQSDFSIARGVLSKPA